MNFLQPCIIVSSLAEIKLEELQKKGKRGIILDLDNTITPWQHCVLTKEAQEFITKAQCLSFKVHLLSNAARKRPEKIALQLGIGFTAPGYKPMQRGYREALGKLSLSGDQVIAVGDQIITDIWGGNRAGCYTILVSPTERRKFIAKKIMRLLEAFSRR